MHLYFSHIPCIFYEYFNLQSTLIRGSLLFTYLLDITFTLQDLQRQLPLAQKRMLGGLFLLVLAFSLHIKVTSDQVQVEGTTESSKRPIHSSPGFKVIGFSIAAPSTQSICLYSSSPKSATALDFFSQGFQTTMQYKS